MSLWHRASPITAITRVAQPAASSRAIRAFTFMPSRPLRAGHDHHHNHHPIPPEGDIDHGRSGWGFQSASRHEHFTFPGEDPEPYEWHPTFNTPRWWLLAFSSAALYYFWDHMPDYPEPEFTPGSYQRKYYDSMAKLGPDDKRSWWQRWDDWARGDPDPHFEAAAAEYELKRRVMIANRTNLDRVVITNADGERIDRSRQLHPPRPGMSPGTYIDQESDRFKTAANDNRRVLEAYREK